MAYKPSAPFAVAMVLLCPSYSTTAGVPVKTFPSVANSPQFNASFKSYGGTERDVNGLYSVEDTAIVETWYRPDIKSDCRIVKAETGAAYEILGAPEDIEGRHQYLRMKVRRIKGGA